eukprot:TRINITY_DN2809_c0_g1_i3.p1 TRINITY_DN2809_c0_g1~~TRINITY_DN2809_c0_g1_i3.p1  ORF type:complete len:103 (+),score=17.38 TRINITY_DN2809_c0_g1_i3:73-381(+)
MCIRDSTNRDDGGHWGVHHIQVHILWVTSGSQVARRASSFRICVHVLHHLAKRARGATYRDQASLYFRLPHTCLLYTSDAADEEDSVDLGGRRIIKKKKDEK